jgi:hypothetical protein
MKKELYTLDEADAVWTAAAKRGYSTLESALKKAPQPYLSQIQHEASTVTR